MAYATVHRGDFVKIAVYAISKNEEKFVERWVNSMNEADEIYVADTGSTDNTVELLKQKGVIVNSVTIEPWRFDVARNKSLEFVSKDVDICVCTDLDEVFTKGWRAELEEKWTNDTTNARYSYIWSFDENGKPQTSFFIEKIHSRHNFKWVYPVHEILQYTALMHNARLSILHLVMQDAFLMFQYFCRTFYKTYTLCRDSAYFCRHLDFLLPIIQEAANTVLGISFCRDNALG